MKANSDTVEYDGEEHSVSGFEKNEFEVEGSKYTVEDVEAEAKGIEAGVYTTDINGTAKVSDAGGNDVTGQFAVSYESGSLTITAVESGEGPAGDSSKGGGPGGSGGGGSGAGTTGTGLDIDTIIENGVPVAAAPSGYWAILNLIMMIATVLGGIYMIFKRYRDEDDSDDYEGQATADDAADDGSGQNRRRKRILSVIAAAALAIISAIVFFITEDMTNTPALFDKYTLLMAAMLIASIAFIINGKKADDENAEEEGAN